MGSIGQPVKKTTYIPSKLPIPVELPKTKEPAPVEAPEREREPVPA
ncbi:hypothetical protein LCGC14_1177440 [marine sediment metagenome]|uniref:Uncharacterized protein n=1 Tax=marine sediment metagenome TaxID=412755 RepID=A0A0F9LN72_9ZZZZ